MTDDLRPALCGLCGGPTLPCVHTSLTENGLVFCPACQKDDDDGCLEVVTWVMNDRRTLQRVIDDKRFKRPWHR